MSIKSILFNTEMVQAILDGKKTVIRRVVKGLNFEEDLVFRELRACRKEVYPLFVHKEFECLNQYGTKATYQKNNVIYVRETWCSRYDGEKYFYFADKHTPREEKHLIDYDEIKWNPSIHMPKKAARIWLRVTDVHVERLQDITVDEIRKEGLKSMSVHCGDMSMAAPEFKLLWNSAVKLSDIDKYGWDANPFVWVIDFERCEKPE